MGYRDDAKIDIYSLHTEWAGQPTVYMDYAEQYADAVAFMMRAQEKVSVTKTEGKKKIDEKRAEVDADIRASFTTSDGKKLTEAAITNLIVLDEEFKGVQEQVAQEVAVAINDHIEAVRNKELLEGVKVGFSHRKTALENEVQLFLQGYYSDPKVPKSYKEAQQQDVRKGIEESLKDMEQKTLARRRRPVVEGA